MFKIKEKEKSKHPQKIFPTSPDDCNVKYTSRLISWKRPFSKIKKEEQNN